MDAWTFCHARLLQPWQPWEVAAVVEQLLRAGAVVGHEDGAIEAASTETKQRKAISATEGIGKALLDVMPEGPRATKTKTVFGLVVGVLRIFNGDTNEEKKR